MRLLYWLLSCALLSVTVVAADPAAAPLANFGDRADLSSWLPAEPNVEIGWTDWGLDPTSHTSTRWAAVGDQLLLTETELIVGSGREGAVSLSWSDGAGGRHRSTTLDHTEAFRGWGNADLVIVPTRREGSHLTWVVFDRHDGHVIQSLVSIATPWEGCRYVVASPVTMPGGMVLEMINGLDDVDGVRPSWAVRIDPVTLTITEPVATNAGGLNNLLPEDPTHIVGLDTKTHSATRIDLLTGAADPAPAESHPGTTTAVPPEQRPTPPLTIGPFPELSGFGAVLGTFEDNLQAIVWRQQATMPQVLANTGGMQIREHMQYDQLPAETQATVRATLIELEQLPAGLRFDRRRRATRIEELHLEVCTHEGGLVYLPFAADLVKQDDASAYWLLDSGISPYKLDGNHVLLRQIAYTGPDGVNDGRGLLRLGLFDRANGGSLTWESWTTLPAGFGEYCTEPSLAIVYYPDHLLLGLAGESLEPLDPETGARLSHRWTASIATPDWLKPI
ncbi:MAG: hypothetical protein ABI743_02735, partial [bacterium]